VQLANEAQITANDEAGSAQQPARARWQDARASLSRLERASRYAASTWLTVSSALALCIVLLVAAIFLFIGSIHEIRGRFAEVQHTDEVLLRTADAERNLIEMGSAVRAFVLSRSPLWAAIYRQSKADVGAGLRDLRALTIDNPAETRRLDDIKPVFEALTVLLDRVIARQDKTDERKLNDLQARARLAIPILRKLEDVRAAELKLLAERQAKTDADTASLLLLAIGAGMLALASGGFAALVILRERSRHQARELQLEFMHTQRLSMMGQTSAMLAHEINQPLAAARNYMSVTKRLIERPATEGTAKIGEMVQRATEQVERAAQIVKRLRNFIDKKPAERGVEQPATLIADAIALFGTFDKSVIVDVQVQPDIPFVRVDRVQLQQVFVNLIRNALEAMHDSPRKELMISASAHNRDFIEISLRDTGPGLPPEVEEHLFEPFVSGKADGLGVGLSICQTIVADHGGRIWARSVPGGGTVFHFTLPAAELAAAA
jgi:C4-dicarboxylate-specific signal transduction histidine kinase